MTQWRLGVIGTGGVAPAVAARYDLDSPFRYGAFRVTRWSASPEASDAGSAAAFAARSGAKFVWAPSSVLEDPAIDAVLVCTPVDARGALVNQALSAGKHVMCPAPAWTIGDSADCNASVSPASSWASSSASSAASSWARPPVLFVPGSIASSLAGRRAIEEISAGRLGDLWSIYLGIRLRHEPGIGAALSTSLWDALDFIARCVPEGGAGILRAFAQSGALFGDNPDSMMFNMRFRDGTIVSAEISASLSSAFPGPVPDIDIDIAGRDATLRIEPNKQTVVVYGQSGASVTPWLNDSAVNMLEEFAAKIAAAEADAGGDPGCAAASEFRKRHAAVLKMHAMLMESITTGDAVAR